MKLKGLLALREDNILTPSALESIKGGDSSSQICNTNRCTLNSGKCGINDCNTNSYSCINNSCNSNGPCNNNTSCPTNLNPGDTCKPALA